MIPGCKGKGGGPSHDYCYDPKIEVKKPNPCAKNNGGCDKARKCMNSNGKAKCGNCPKGFTNLGATKCKKAVPADKNLSGGNNGGAKNLKACSGECDADSQCAKGLKCFQRSKGEKIPGCKGNGGGKDWDYCYNPLHGGVKTLSGGNSGSAKNLQRCVGECDADSQCAYGLKCFQRKEGEPIPGCKGNGGGKDWDYCYDPKTEKPNPCKKNNGGCDKARKCMNSNGKAKCGNCPKGYTNYGATKCKKVVTSGDKNLSCGNSGGAKNLKACTGECDADSQCAKGLKCFQRSKGEKIPGCKGNGGGKDWDYCYHPLHGGVKELGGTNNGNAKNLQRCV